MQEIDYVIRDKIKDTLIELRVEHELTQTDVGKIAGKSKTAVASWEQGLSLPDISTLFRLSKYYGKSIDYMYGVREDSNLENKSTIEIRDTLKYLRSNAGNNCTLDGEPMSESNMTVLLDAIDVLIDYMKKVTK